MSGGWVGRCSTPSAAYTREKIRQGQDWGWQRWDAARATWQNFRQDPRGFAQEVVRQGQRAWQQGRGTVSAVLDFVPVVGEVKNLIEAVVGTDLAGHKLSKLEQTLLVAGALLGAFTLLDEIADAASLARHAANNVELAGDALKASRGLGHLDEAGDIARGLDQALLTHADDLDNARAIRNADNLAISRRLDNLDEFTGGGRSLSREADLRQRLTNGVDSGSLKERRLATKAWKRSGADLNDPVVRQAIRNGEFPTIRGGSGQFDDVIVLYHGTQPKYRSAFQQGGELKPVGSGDLGPGFYTTRRPNEAIDWAGDRGSLTWTEKDVIAIEVSKAKFEKLTGKEVTPWEYYNGITENEFRRTRIIPPDEEIAELRTHFDSFDFNYGPVTDKPGYEQLVFKSEEAFKLLNSSPRSIYRVTRDGKLEFVERVQP